LEADKKQQEFPRTARRQGYRLHPGARGRPRCEVRYFHVDGAQHRPTFATYEAAKEFADAAVREIAHNRSNFITLRGQAASEYQHASEVLSTMGLSVPQAADLVSEGLRLLNGTAGVLEAIKYFIDNRPRKSCDIAVRQVVDELLALRQQEGAVGSLHLRDLRNRLGRFAEKYNCPISKVSSVAIRQYILDQKVGERTRHNLRTTLAMLFNFAAAEGYGHSVVCHCAR
jgi:hypothetical protein